LTLKLAKAVALKGHVRSRSVPAPDFALHLDGPTHGESFRFPRADGSYEVRGLQPGPYVAAITSAQGFAGRKMEIASGTAIPRLAWSPLFATTCPPLSERSEA
jgi:hypothetical protein